MNQLTFGELAVGLSFNPSQMPEVDEVKRAFAKIIDQMNAIETSSYLGNTFKGMAIRALIEAKCMTVQLLTFKETPTNG